jgi:hypothetical protein
MRPPRHLRPVTPPQDSWGDQETTDPIDADNRAFFKVERWSKDGHDHIEEMLFAGNRLEKARTVFADAVKRRPGGSYTIRQGIRVLRKWPED